MTFIRTVLGDIDPADLGSTYAHEHLVIDGGRLRRPAPDFLLVDVDSAVAELEAPPALGLRSMVDAMPFGPAATSSAGRGEPPERRPRDRPHGPPPASSTRPPPGRARLAEDLATCFDGRHRRRHRHPRLPRPDCPIARQHRAGVIKIAGSAELTVPRAPRVRSRRHRPRPDRLPDPHPLHRRARSARAGAPARRARRRRRAT